MTIGAGGALTAVIFSTDLLGASSTAGLVSVRDGLFFVEVSGCLLETVLVVVSGTDELEAEGADVVAGEVVVDAGIVALAGVTGAGETCAGALEVSCDLPNCIHPA